jgi:hypothetical protein
VGSFQTNLGLHLQVKQRKGNVKLNETGKCTNSCDSFSFLQKEENIFISLTYVPEISHHISLVKDICFRR